MTVVTTRPDATVANGGSTIGGGAGSRHAALSDDSDSTYVDTAGGMQHMQIGFAEPSIPAGGVLKSLAVRARIGRHGSPSGPSHAVIAAFGEGWDGYINWDPATTITTVIDSAPDAADIVAIVVDVATGSAFPRFYELYCNTVYVAKPTLTVDSPTGTLTTDNAPAVGWTPTLDSDGGAQTFYEVRVFNSTQYGAGGFSAGSSTAAAESGILAGNATSWDMTDIGATLPNATYKAYVRVGQTLSDGTIHWSNYTAGSAFVINTPLPAVPTITLTDEGSTLQRQKIVAADPGGGAATTDLFQIQRSDDSGTTYADIRTLLGDGIVDDDDPAAYDYEAENGATVSYRARSIHDASGTYAFSAWATASGSWNSTKQSIKHGTDPSLSVECTFTSQPGHRRPARQGVFQPLGATRPVVVSDTRGSDQGELTVMVAEADLDTFTELIEANVPLLIQAPANHKWPDRWVSIGDVDFSRYVDKSWVEEGLVALLWVEVSRPDGDLIAWS